MKQKNEVLHPDHYGEYDGILKNPKQRGRSHLGSLCLCVLVEGLLAKN